MFNTLVVVFGQNGPCWEFAAFVNFMSFKKKKK